MVAAAAMTVCHGQLGVSTNDMQLAVTNLSAGFTRVRNEGLGINLIEVSFS